MEEKLWQQPNCYYVPKDEGRKSTLVVVVL
ncbi:hypothetical protein MJO29_001694 [Puccinia striiformis f. sp. tritici]|nr:hypothetical protein MJO29_001694 [Puccinia striiformis f. sp. tritici]